MCALFLPLFCSMSLPSIVLFYDRVGIQSGERKWPPAQAVLHGGVSSSDSH
jgi:hypothetical protein